MRYEIILADPPWLYSNEQNKDPSRGGVVYPKLTLAELTALPVSLIAAPDCLLFLWVPFPKLPEGLTVLEAWGFRYITTPFVWVKTNLNGNGIYSGMGYWTNGNVELILMGKRGKPKRAARNVKQVITAPVSRHSAKPPEARERIVHLVGDRPRIELFARDCAEGWTATGLEWDGRDIRVALADLVR